MRKKTKALFIRVTPEQLKEWDRQVEKSAFSTRSAWIRHRVSTGSERPPDGGGGPGEWLRESAKLRFELAQLGNNLNQLVRRVHARQVHSTREAESLLLRLATAVREVKDRLDLWCRVLEDRN